MENLNYQNENIERKYSKIMRKNQFLKVKISLLELEKDFIELKDRKVKIKRETEELQSTLAISNMRYLEFRAISNFFPSPFSIYGLLPHKMSRYLELISWSQGRITVAISNFSENIAQRNQCIKIFSCVFEHVFLIECYFNWFSNVFFLNHSMLE